MSTKKSNQILFAGDFVPCDTAVNTYQSCINNTGVLAFNRIINDCAFSFANLEAPVTDANKKMKKAGPSLRVNVENIMLLKELSFTHVNLANNHICDYGQNGLDDTLAKLNQLQIGFNGVKTKGKSNAKVICDVNNLKVAVFNFCENEFCTLDGDNGAELINPTENYRTIMDESEADYKIVILHGGTEHCNLPNPWFKDLCRYYIDIGVDLVISHHTHVFSGSEVYKGKNIYYGLGNFIFSNSHAVNSWHKGYLVRVNVENDGLSTDIIPYKQMKGGEFINLLQNDELSVFMEEYQRLSVIIKTEVEYKLFWEQYNESKRVDYLSSAQGMGRISRGIFRKFGIRIKGLGEEKKLLRLMNHINCQSHRDTLRFTISKFLNKNTD